MTAKSLIGFGGQLNICEFIELLATYSKPANFYIRKRLKIGARLPSGKTGIAGVLRMGLLPGLSRA